jgi:nitrogen fixation protein FixH
MTIRWHWGTKIAVVYAAFASATVGFVLFAMARPVDLVRADYYARSLEHDARLAAAARAEALGAGFAMTASADGRAITVVWPRGHAGAAGTIALYRPADSRADRSMAIAPDSEGRQTISLADAPAGPWTLQVEWRAQGLAYYAERRVVAR